jgi:hypothetical protein
MLRKAIIDCNNRYIKKARNDNILEGSEVIENEGYSTEEEGSVISDEEITGEFKKNSDYSYEKKIEIDWLITDLQYRCENYRYGGCSKHRYEYNRATSVASNLGDVEIDYFWYGSSVHTIDKTNEVQFYCPNINEFVDEEYYTSSRLYKPVIKNLTRKVSSRQFGKVFFSTETRYIEADKLGVSDKPFLLRNYIVRNNRKFYRKTYQRKIKNVLYTTSSHGILKFSTIQGALIEKVLNNREIERQEDNNITRSSRLKQFYRELQDVGFDYERWLNETPYRLPWDYFLDRLNHRTEYNNKSYQYDRYIDRLIIRSNNINKSFKPLVRKIKERFSQRLAAGSKIRNFLQKKYLQSIGREREIV